MRHCHVTEGDLVIAALAIATAAAAAADKETAGSESDSRFLFWGDFLEYGNWKFGNKKPKSLV